jgi:DNA-binding NarL/FixJ family response regulator
MVPDSPRAQNDRGWGIRDGLKGSGNDPMHARRARHVRVLIAADHPPSIDKIRGLVFSDFEVVGTVNGVGEQALCGAFRLKPDILLVEVAAAVKDHFETVTAISQRLPHAWIIFFQSGTGSPAREPSAHLSSALPRRSGASSDSSDDGLERDPVMPGAQCAVNAAQQHRGHPGSQELTGREYEVLALLAAGHPMKHIASRLGITYRTVTSHKYRMMERLGVSTNAGLIAYALRNSSTNVDYRKPTTVA